MEPVPESANDIVAFTVIEIDPATTRGRIRIEEALRGELAGDREASFPGAVPRVYAKLIAAVHPQPDGSLIVDPRACWPYNDLHRARVVWGTNAAVTIIVCEGDDPDAFEELELDERRRRSGGFKRLPVRSGIRLCTFLMFATHNDFGVFGAAEEIDAPGETVDSSVIFGEDIDVVLPMLQRLVETEPEQTARLLHVHGGGTGDLARISEALRTGRWPTIADPAEEAAAFAFHLLKYARDAQELRLGVCWEYRGKVRALLTPPPTERRRDLETLLATIRRANMFATHVDMWEHGGSSSATPEQRTTMYAELAESNRTCAAATAALEELVTRTRAEAPAELDAWAFAHYAYCSQFLHECAERGQSGTPSAADAERDRAEWAEVRAGKRTFVHERYVPQNTYFYRSYFGIDPETLERVDVDA